MGEEETVPHLGMTVEILVLHSGFSQDHTPICALDGWFAMPTSLSPGAGISLGHFRLGVLSVGCRLTREMSPEEKCNVS